MTCSATATWKSSCRTKARGANTALLRWNGNGFDEIRNWIPPSIWRIPPAELYAQSWMSLADFDRDGKLDLLVTGKDRNPNFQIVFGGPGGFTAGALVVLPDGPFGHTPGGSRPGTLSTGEISPVVVADFDNDGLTDIFAVIRNITRNPDDSIFYGDSTDNIRLNRGSRMFVDRSPSPYVNLGRVEYQNLMAADVNSDGFLDVVGTYAAEPPRWGTTVFLNDGTGAFQLVDGAEFIGVTTTPPNGNRRGLGSFLPTVLTPQRTEAVVYESLGGCGVPSACNATGLNIYKVVANGSLGTGPNFADSNALGVPGFNEFYYLNHYSDAAGAVQAGQFRNGLDHYRAVGAEKGYLTHAPNNAIPPGVSLWSDNKAFRVTFQEDGNVVIYDATQRALWFTNTAGATGGTLVLQSDGNLVLRDRQNAVRWESGTAGNPGASFGIQGDGNLVIFNANGAPIWGAYGH